MKQNLTNNKMIKKQEIVDVLVEEGMSIIECDRAANSKEEFQQAIQGLIEERISDITH